MPLLRRLAFPLRLARARVARASGRLALVALGLAAAAATVAAVSAGSTVAQDRSVARSVGRLPEPERAVRAAWFGVPNAGSGRAALDREAERAVRRITPSAPVETLLYRRTSIRGRLVDLGAVDGLAPWVRLRSGRLPRPCTRERCEVLQLAGRGPIPMLRDVELVVVGKAALTSDVLLGEFVKPGTYHQPATPPLLLAEGVETLASTRELESIYRSYGWVLPLEDVHVRARDVDGLAERVAAARATLRAADIAFDVEAPTTALEDAAAAARAAGRRLLLVGGQAAALLLAFSVLAAATARRSTEAARLRLTWFGARRWQLELVTAAEVAAVAFAGTLVGWAGGTAVAAAVARAADEPVGAVLRHSVLSPAGLVGAVALALVTGLVVHLAVRARPVQVRRLSLAPVDVAAMGALAVVAVVLARGSTDAAALARERGTGVLLLILPGLVAFVAAVAAARALVPALRLLERTARTRSVPLRLAALSLARHPGYAAVATAFLTVSLGLALFAEGYRSTLERGQEDQAAFAVPVDAIVKEDLRELVRPLDAASLEAFGRAAGGAAFPVLRRSASVARLDGSVTLLGLPADAVDSLRWRSDYASSPPDALARRIRPRGDPSFRGVPIPADARSLELPLQIRGTPISISSTLLTPRGTFVELSLGRTAGRERLRLRAPLPPSARGGRLVGLSFLPPRRIEEPGASAGRAGRGVITTPGIRFRGGRTTTVRFAGWRPTNPSVSAVVTSRATQFHYAISQLIHSRFRPAQPTDAGPVPVLATSRLAAAAGDDGVLVVDAGAQALIGRVVGVVRRFPSVEGEAVVADEALVTTALNASQPGSAEPGEVWLRGERARAGTLAGPPFTALALTTRTGELERLRDDPLAAAALLTLTSAALVGLALAVVGLLLGVVSDLRDERGELFDLEAQGATPAMLRRQARLRAAIVAGVGVLGGGVTGALLSFLVVDLVRLTANAADAEPPLLLSVSWPVVAAAVAGYAAVAGALVGLATVRGFRAPAAVPGTERGA
ncbi:MAG: hypothetical protein ICV74_02270 [Thermoleophilia bacterium]|nr:hypothetical protein [Thermoleophilia bacterium]